MPKELDVYRDWLGVTDAERPLNYYQLLRLKKFEEHFPHARYRMVTGLDVTAAARASCRTRGWCCSGSWPTGAA